MTYDEIERRTGLTEPNDIPPVLLGMLVSAVKSGSAPPGGVVRLRLIDRTDNGDQEIQFIVSVDEARQHLREQGYLQ